MAFPPESFDDFSLGDLRRAVATLAAQGERPQNEVSTQAEVIAELKLTVAARGAKIAEQADEIARLKGLPPRPLTQGNHDLPPSARGF